MTNLTSSFKEKLDFGSYKSSEEIEVPERIIDQIIGQKEAVETVIAALAQTETEMIDETSDLVFHLLVLLREKGLSLETIAKNLEQRHK